MNTLKITVLFAMLVGVALSRTCSNICKTPCNVTFQSCQFVSAGNVICTADFNLCNGACDAVCACDDQCEDQCQGPLNTCLEANAGNVIGQGSCDVEFGFCVNTCQVQCATTSVTSGLFGI